MLSARRELRFVNPYVLGYTFKGILSNSDFKERGERGGSVKKPLGEGGGVVGRHAPSSSLVSVSLYGQVISNAVPVPTNGPFLGQYASDFIARKGLCAATRVRRGEGESVRVLEGA